MSAHLTPRFRLSAALLASFACLAGFTPPAEAVRLNGHVAVQGTEVSGDVWFNCEGTSTCQGTYVAVMGTTACPDEVGRIDDITIAGLDLSKTGSITGTVTLKAVQGPSIRRNPDGTCEAIASPLGDFTTTVTGTWDGTRAQLTSPPMAGVTLSGGFTVVTRLANVTGSLSGSGVGGAFAQATFSCQGEDPCTGTATLTQREEGCSNTYTFTDRFAVIGLSASQTGSRSGGILLRNGDFYTQRNPDGTCTFSPSPSRDGGEWATTSWNGSSGSIVTDPLDDYELWGSYSATFTTLAGVPPPPVFEMTVTTNITPTVSSATANIQYRPADVGRSGSVYAFAVAPQNLVKMAGVEAPLVVGKAKLSKATGDTSVACVLAQLNGSGQLQAVSSSSLQAYVTGVLSSHGQAVSVLDGVATASIAGSTFYVGYGSDASAMISGGVNRSVVTVPGTAVCQPQPPQTGWWWYAAEDGRGYTIESTGSKIFFAAYLYDVSGRSTWYIAAGPASLDGSLFVGNLESYTNGQTLTGEFRSPVRPPVLNGQVTLAFSDATHGTLIWPGGTVPITRMEFGVGGVNAVPQEGQPESGWWLSGQDDGRGFFIEWQAGVAFMAGFMYDDTGAPVWYIAAKPRTSNPLAFSSQWEKYVNGQTLMGTYRPPDRPPAYVGAATIQFRGAADAIMTMPGGRQVTLSRYRF